MPILLLVVVGYGVFRARHWEYWKWLVYAFIASTVVSTFFRAGGTVENPVGDGLVTYWLRQISNDGPLVALAVPSIIIFWILFVYFMIRAWRAGKKINAGILQPKPASDIRKALEFTCLSAVLIFNIVANVMYPIDPREVLASIGISLPGVAQAANPSVEDEIQSTALKLNADTPRDLDEATRLLSITSDGRTFIHELAIRSVDYSTVTKGPIEGSLFKTLCPADAGQLMIEYDVSYKYLYQRMDGTPLFDVFVDGDGCKAAGY